METERGGQEDEWLIGVGVARVRSAPPFIFITCMLRNEQFELRTAARPFSWQGTASRAAVESNSPRLVVVTRHMIRLVFIYTAFH